MSHPEKLQDWLKVCINGRFVLVWCKHVFTGLADRTPDNLMNLQILYELQSACFTDHTAQNPFLIFFFNKVYFLDEQNGMKQ